MKHERTPLDPIHEASDLVQRARFELEQVEYEIGSILAQQTSIGKVYAALDRIEKKHEEASLLVCRKADEDLAEMHRTLARGFEIIAGGKK